MKRQTKLSETNPDFEKDLSYQEDRRFWKKQDQELKQAEKKHSRCSKITEESSPDMPAHSLLHETIFQEIRASLKWQVDQFRDKLKAHQLLPKFMKLKTWIPQSFWNACIVPLGETSDHSHYTTLSIDLQDLDVIFGVDWWKKKMISGTEPDGWFVLHSPIHLRWYHFPCQELVIEAKWFRSPERDGEP